MAKAQAIICSEEGPKGIETAQILNSEQVMDNQIEAAAQDVAECQANLERVSDFIGRIEPADVMAKMREARRNLEQARVKLADLAEANGTPLVS